MEGIKGMVGKYNLGLNLPLAKLFKKQKQREDPVDILWQRKVSGLPLSSDVRFNGDSRIEYLLGQYSYARVFMHPDAMYNVVEPELTPPEEEIINSLKNRMLKTVLATNDNELKNEIYVLMKKLAIDVPAPSRDRIIYYLLRDFTGYGVIDPLTNDSNVEDISCNGVGVPIYVQHRYLGSIQTNLIFDDDNTLDNFVAKIAMRCGKSISMAKPILDAGMPDGNRVNLTYGREVTPKGSTFTIRKFKTHVISLVELIQEGAISPEMLAYLWTLIQYKSSIMVFGETGSGKTTLLNAFSLFIPPEMKIITIEDTPEIRLPHQNWIRSVTRSSFSGEGTEITMFELLKASLRQRPEYLIVGEIRGEEAKALFQAISTGQLGLSTMHASSAESVIDRLTSPPMNIPLSLISNIGCLCHQITIKNKDGHMERRTSSITEIVRNGDSVELNPVFKWDPQKGFKYRGNAKLGWDSRQLDSIALKSGIGKKQLEEDMKEKTRILQEMADTDVHNVAKMISNYYRIRNS